MTLDGPFVDVTVEPAEQFSIKSNNKKLSEKDSIRFIKTIELIKSYLATTPYPLPPTPLLSVSIESHIPPSVGLASSAAVFSALAKAIAQTYDHPLSDEQISVMARLGSGSATRSIFGGYGAIRNEENMFIDGSKGWQIADENHWTLYDIIIVPSVKEKTVGSTEGHASAHTSPHFAERLKDIASCRQEECINAIIKKDFEKLQKVSEEDCMNMHLCMQTQIPSLQYLSEETHRIITEIQDLRKQEHLPVLFTMDAGPTVHLICTQEAKDRIVSYAHEQEECLIFETQTGKGSCIL